MRQKALGGKIIGGVIGKLIKKVSQALVTIFSANFAGMAENPEKRPWALTMSKPSENRIESGFIARLPQSKRTIGQNIAFALAKAFENCRGLINGAVPSQVFWRGASQMLVPVADQFGNFGCVATGKALIDRLKCPPANQVVLVT